MPSRHEVRLPGQVAGHVVGGRDQLSTFAAGCYPETVLLVGLLYTPPLAKRWTSEEPG